MRLVEYKTLYRVQIFIGAFFLVTFLFRIFQFKTASAIGQATGNNIDTLLIGIFFFLTGMYNSSQKK